jgi:oxygen-dependent protoporphyrinogen oxidase
MGCRVLNLSSFDGQARRRGAGRWNITVDNSFNSSGQRQDFDADIVVLSTPAKALSPIMQSTDASIAAALSKVQYSSSAVLNMLFDASDIDQTINGFGFVVPEIEKRSILACSFSSTKFAGRVPPNKVLLRVFVGGVLHPELFELSDGELIQTALHDLRAYMKISRYPNRVWIKRWTKAMPQYNLGHFELVQNLKRQFAAHEGLVWCGSALTGVGIPDCVRAGFESATAVQELIGKYPRSTVSV